MKRVGLVLLLSSALFCACGGGTSGDDEIADDDAVDDVADDDDVDDDDDAADDDTWPPWPDDDAVPEYPESCADGPVLIFNLEAEPVVAPFPNDLFTVADAASPTGLRMALNERAPSPIGALATSPALKFLRDPYNRLTGFSTLADLFFPIGVEPVEGSLPDLESPSIDDGLFLMVDDPGGAHDGEFVALEWDWSAPNLRLTPWVPLRQSTHYVLVATRALQTESGCYRASSGMRTIWSAWATGEGGDTGLRYAPILARLSEAGLSPDEVLSIAEFTTGAMTAGLESAVEVLEERAAQDPPTFYDWDVTPSAEPGLWATALATVDIPIFQDAHGVWRLDGAGRPIVDHVEAVRVYFTIPAEDAHADGPPYPMLMFAHGIFNDKYEMRAPFTTDSAARGFATVSMDAVCHGDRLPPGTGEIGQALCFYNVFRPEAIRDNFRETVTDWVWVRRALDSLADLDTDDNDVSDLDPDRVAFMGMSLGSLMTSLSAGVDARIDAHLPVASGARFTTIVTDGEAGPYLDLIGQLEDWLAPGRPITDALYVLSHVFQSIADPADPANFVNHVLDDTLSVVGDHRTQVFQQGSAYDEVIGGPAGAWLCRAGGWPQLTPYAWDVGAPHVDAPYAGSAFFQFDTSEHTLIFDNDPVGTAAREQVLHFLRTWIDDGVGEIVAPNIAD